MSFTAGITQQVSTPQTNPKALSRWNINGYVFDAFLSLDHSGDVTTTSHPVETGANISDHIYLNPLAFSFEIGVSDVMKSIIPGQFGGASSRVQSAYNVLTQMRDSRQFVTLTSKYGYFEDVIVKSVRIRDTIQTYSAMRATVQLERLILAGTQSKKVSLLPHVTDQTPRGQQSTLPAPGTLQAAFFDISKLLSP